MPTIEQELKSSQSFSDQDLTECLTSSVLNERNDLAAVLVLLAEFDRRRLGPSKGYRSLFAYCTIVLKYSSAAAARRIVAARAGRRYPCLLAMVRKGELHLEGAAMLAPHLNSENRRRLFRQARGRGIEEIARIIATAAPRALKRDHIRIVAAPPEAGLPDPVRRAIENPAFGQWSAPAGPASAGPAPEGLAPDGPAPASPDPEEAAPGSLAPGSPAPADDGWEAVFGSAPSLPAARAPSAGEIFRVSFDADGETMKMLRRAQELTRHRFPKGELNFVIKVALDLLLEREDRDRARQGRAHAPFSEVLGRRIPEGVKRAAWDRDKGECAWVGTDGVACGSRAWIEFDHIRPVALGGPSGLGNVRLLCREHNQLAATEIFGERSSGPGAEVGRGPRR